MKIGQFLREKIGLEAPGLDALDRLAGRSLGTAHFHADLDAAVRSIGKSTPLYVLPVGQESSIHLRPEDVSRKRLAFLHGVEGQYVEEAGSIEHFAFRRIAELEGLWNEDGGGRTALDSAVAVANEIFGKDFYQPGRHGKFEEREVSGVVSKVYGTTPWDVAWFGLRAPEPAEQLAVFEAGVKADPSALYSHGCACRVALELGRKEPAAAHFVQSLACHFHTANTVGMDDHLERGVALAKAVPKAFPGESRELLSALMEPKKFQPYVEKKLGAGEMEAVAKLKTDLSYLAGDYRTGLPELAALYDRLGWRWAAALCVLRK